MHWRIFHACTVCRIVLIGLGALGGVYALKRLSTKQHGHGTNLPHLSSLQYSQHARICTIIRCCGGDKCRHCFVFMFVALKISRVARF